MLLSVCVSIIYRFSCSKVERSVYQKLVLTERRFFFFKLVLSKKYFFRIDQMPCTSDDIRSSFLFRDTCHTEFAPVDAPVQKPDFGFEYGLLSAVLYFHDALAIRFDMIGRDESHLQPCLREIFDMIRKLEVFSYTA